jgi:hypothetical protein
MVELVLKPLRSLYNVIPVKLTHRNLTTTPTNFRLVFALNVHLRKAIMFWNSSAVYSVYVGWVEKSAKDVKQP